MRQPSDRQQNCRFALTGACILAVGNWFYTETLPRPSQPTRAGWRGGPGGLLYWAGVVLGPDADGDGGAPLADLVVADAVDGAVFPEGEGGGVWGGIGVAGRGIEGQGTPAGAAIDLHFQHVEEFAVALPVPLDVDDSAADADLEHGGEDGEIGRSCLGADDPEVLADGFGVGVGLFDLLDEIENAVQRACGTGHHGGERRDGGGICSGERWRQVRGEHVVAGGRAVEGFLCGLGDGFGVGAFIGHPGTEDVDAPAGIRHGGGAGDDGDAQGGSMTLDFIPEVCQPEELVRVNRLVVTIVFHTFCLCFVWFTDSFIWVGRVALIARFQDESPAAILSP